MFGLFDGFYWWLLRNYLSKNVFFLHKMVKIWNKYIYLQLITYTLVFVQGGWFYMIKSVVDALSCGFWNLGNFELLVKGQGLKWLLRVWYNRIPECAMSVSIYALHTFGILIHIGVGRHSTRSPTRFLRTSKPDERRWKSTFLVV